MTNKTDDQEDIERMLLCRSISEAITSFSIFITKKAGGDPVEMIVGMSMALLEANVAFAKEGEIESSFQALIEGLETMHRKMVDAKEEDIAMEEAMMARAMGQFQ